MTFENVRLTGRFLSKKGEMCEGSAIEIRGLDDSGHTIRNIKFKNITICNENKGADHNIVMTSCEGISLDNIICK